jgi:hypothetical protein
MNGEDTVKIGGRDFEKSSLVNVSGAIDEQGRVAKGGSPHCRYILHIALIGDIAADRDGSTADRPNIGGDSLRSLFYEIIHRHGRAIRRETAGNCPTDARAAAGNDCDRLP